MEENLPQILVARKIRKQATGPDLRNALLVTVTRLENENHALRLKIEAAQRTIRLLLEHLER